MSDHEVMRDRRSVAVEVADDLATSGQAQAVVLHGSVARRSDRPDSDVDLLVVRDGDRSFRRWTAREGVDVEVVADSEAGWIIRFGDNQPMWLYAWSDGEVLIDPDGVADLLKRQAVTMFRSYRTPDELRVTLSGFWEHVGPKARAVRSRGDPEECGFMASTLTEKLVESAFAIEDRPLPPGALRFMLLQELIRGHPSEQSFGQLFTADPLMRLDAVLDLSASYLHSLKND